MKFQRCNNKNILVEISQIINFLKIISEENRLKILCVLKNGEKCVCDIWQFLNLPQNLVSYHLKVLEDWGLVLSRREGLKVFYQLNEKVVKKYLIAINKILNK